MFGQNNHAMSFSLFILILNQPYHQTQIAVQLPYITARPSWSYVLSVIADLLVISFFSLFVHDSLLQLKYYFLNNFSLLDGLFRLVCLLMVHSYFIMIIDKQNVVKLPVGTFSDNTCSSTTVFILPHMEHQSIASF